MERFQFGGVDRVRNDYFEVLRWCLYWPCSRQLVILQVFPHFHSIVTMSRIRKKMRHQRIAIGRSDPLTTFSRRSLSAFFSSESACLRSRFSAHAGTGGKRQTLIVLQAQLAVDDLAVSGNEHRNFEAVGLDRSDHAIDGRIGWGSSKWMRFQSDKPCNESLIPMRLFTSKNLTAGSAQPVSRWHGARSHCRRLRNSCMKQL